MTGNRWCALALLASAWVGCDSATRAQEQAEDVTAERMAHHFEQALRARDALVRGDLPAARAAARELARPAPDSALRRPELDAMRARARELASARSVPDASQSVARVALACGDCHRASSAEIRASEAPPPPGDDPTARMRQHLWATDRLFDGLALPDDAEFAAGAAALLRAPLYSATAASTQSVSPEVRQLADRVRERAREARRATDARGRAAAYGSILATCADCHRLVGIAGPAAPVAI